MFHPAMALMEHSTSMNRTSNQPQPLSIVMVTYHLTFRFLHPQQLVVPLRSLRRLASRSGVVAFVAIPSLTFISSQVKRRTN